MLFRTILDRALPRALVTGAALACATLIAAPPAGAANLLLSQTDRQIYIEAFAAVDDRDFDRADALVAGASNKLLGKAIDWIRLTSTNIGPTFEETAEFIDQNPGWPRLALLQERAEDRIDDTTPPSAIRGFFAGRDPVSAKGMIAWLDALRADGEMGIVAEQAGRLWRALDTNRTEERRILQYYRQYISTDDHIARLDRLLWEGKSSLAERQSAHVPDAYRALAEARIALRGMRGGVDGKIARVPQRLRNDPGLAYERTRWRRKKDLDLDAVDLLDHQAGTDPRWLGLWWRERAILARRLLDDGKTALAYQVAAGHGAEEGLALAEGEFLAGWIALRLQDDPEKAFPHFQRMYDRVNYPVSLSRAAYWAGRAAEAADEGDIARQWYEVAARHGTSFYGQMAARHLPASARPAPPEEPRTVAFEADAFNNRELVRLLYKLSEVDARDTFRLFFRDLARDLTNPIDLSLLAELATTVNRPEEAVYAARQAIKAGVMLPRTGYPVLPLDRTVTLAPDLVYGLIRQESAFERTAISSAGARGLMQLMPATARNVAKQARLPFRSGDLTTNYHYNIALGTHYLQDLLEEFDGSLILALASYNAGPHRARRWIQENGDPRLGEDAALDFIETIPFYETRNYVQRVLENMTVYRQRLTGAPALVTFDIDVKSLPPRQYASLADLTEASAIESNVWTALPRAPRPSGSGL